MSTTPSLRGFWYPLAFRADLTDRPRRVRLLDRDIVVWAGPSGVGAALDRCPHRDAALSMGWLSGDCVVCPYHGWEYGLDGRAARIPQTPGRPVPPKARLETLAVSERYGIVWGSLDPDPPPLPAIPEWDTPGWRLVPEYEWHFDCSAAHLIENNFDPGHVAFVHRATFGNPAMAELVPGEVELRPDGLRLTSELRVDNRPGDAAPSVRRTTADLHLPFFAVFRIAYPDGLIHVMVKACRPEADRSTSLLQFVLRNDTEADVPAASILAFDNAVEAEDQAVLAQMPADLPLDARDQVHIASDRPSLALRRVWRQQLLDRAPAPDLHPVPPLSPPSLSGARSGA